MPVGKPELLTEFHGYVTLRLNEEKSRDGRLVAEGEFGWCDKATANGRIYSKKLMEREFARLRSKMEGRALYGELDHPKDGETSLKRVSHVLRNLTIEPNGRVIGELEVLDHPDIPYGRLLKGLVECGVRLGVSSRGVGSVVKTRDGKFAVQEDFRLLTYDVVADPAWGDANPAYRVEGDQPDLSSSPVYEGADWDKGADMSNISLEQLKAQHPELVEKIEREALRGATKAVRESMEGDYASGLERVIADVKKKAYEEARADFQGGGNASVLEGVRGLVSQTLPTESEAVRQLQTEATHLQGIVESLQQAMGQKEAELETAKMGRDLAAHFTLIPESHQDSFLSIIGKPSDFESYEAFSARVGDVVEDFRSTGRYFENYIDDYRLLVNESSAQISKLMRQNEALAVAKTTVLDLQEEVASLRGEVVESYDHVNSLKIRNDAILESYNSMSEEIKTITEHNEELIEIIESKDELLIRAHEELVENSREIQRLTRAKEEVELDLYRYKQTVGAFRPNEVLESVSGARTKEDVDSILESTNNSRRKTVMRSGSFASSNGGEDAIQESTKDKIFRLARGQGPSIVPLEEGAAPRAGGSSVATGVETVVGGVPTQSGRRRIPGLPVAKAKEMVESNAGAMYLGALSTTAGGYDG